MNTAGRLSLYGAGLIVAFAAAFGVTSAVVPDDAANTMEDPANVGHASPEHEAPADEVPAGEGDTMDHSAMNHGSAGETLPGLSVSESGYTLSPVAAPSRVGEPGELGFQILTEAGEPLTEYTEAHDKDLHLIVVRSDGAQFRHVHPALDQDSGRWSLPWQWAEAGTYRVYADFTPAHADAAGLTLTRTVQVSGDYSPADRQPTRSATVGEYTASIEGDLVAGSATELTISIFRGAEPVTELEPYLGAFGHLVALRDGDLAYLHVHPDADDPRPGETSGPEIAFIAEAPTAGRYLLYLDFQVDGHVRTAEFVLDAAAGDGIPASDHDDDGSHGH